MLIFHSGLSRDFDGPGERMIFYLKGCNFRCDWCASPESISSEPQLLYYAERNQDTSCSNCSSRAYQNISVLDRTSCQNCSDRPCVAVWRNPAFEWTGMTLSVDDILKKTAEMQDFIDGVTFGGGEPTLQISELLFCCDGLKKLHIHTAVESNASTAVYPELAGRVDLLYSDLKTLDPATARLRMGADISLVRQNLCLAAAEQHDFILRIPVVRGVNTSSAVQDELTDFCRELKSLRPDGKTLQVELLRQHHLGEPKYRALGIEYKLTGTQETSPDEVRSFADKLKKHNIYPVVFS